MKAAEVGSAPGLSGPLKDPVELLMSVQADPGLILVVGMSELGILLLLTRGHTFAGLNYNTTQHVLGTVKSALNRARFGSTYTNVGTMQGR